MRHTRFSFTLSAVAIASTVLLTACGGSSSSPSLTAQTIAFSAPSTTVDVGQTVTLSGTSTSSLPLTYTSSTTSVCTINSAGTGVTGVSAGSCTITANQAGNSTYSAATAVPVTFNIALDPQTITFAAPTAPTVGSTATLAATASSGLAVSYASSTPSVCTVSGSTLSAVAAGTCTVTASQTGNATYAAAASVPQSFNISTPAPTVAVFSSGFASGSATVQGGAFGGYSGSNIDNYNCGAPASCGGGGGYVSSTVTAAQSYFYYYYQTPTPATTAEYMGVYVQAPGVTSISGTRNTSGLQLTNQTTMKFTLNQNPEWASQTNHNIAILLTLGNFYSVNGGACNVKLQTVMTPTGGSTSTAYTVPLSQFVVSQNCGISSLTPSSVAAALAASAGGPIVQVDFQGDSGNSALTTGSLTSSANTTVQASGVYPTTIAITGGITFQ